MSRDLIYVRNWKWALTNGCLNCWLFSCIQTNCGARIDAGERFSLEARCEPTGECPTGSTFLWFIQSSSHPHLGESLWKYNCMEFNRTERFLAVSPDALPTDPKADITFIITGEILSRFSYRKLVKSNSFESEREKKIPMNNKWNTIVFFISHTARWRRFKCGILYQSKPTAHHGHVQSGSAGRWWSGDDFYSGMRGLQGWGYAVDISIPLQKRRRSDCKRKHRVWRGACMPSWLRCR